MKYRCKLFGTSLPQEYVTAADAVEAAREYAKILWRVHPIGTAQVLDISVEAIVKVQIDGSPRIDVVGAP